MATSKTKLPPRLSPALFCLFFLCLLSTGKLWGYTANVTNTLGDNSAGSFGEAVSLISANGGGTIDFSAVAGGTINQTALLPLLTQSVTLLGNNVTISGPASQVFNLQNAVTMTQLTLAGGMSVSIAGSGSNVILNGANSYSGGTTVSSSGLVSVSADNNLGATTGTLTLDNGTLRTTAGTSFNAARTLALTTNGGTVDTSGQNSTWNGAIQWTPNSLLSVVGGGTFNFNTTNNPSGTIYDQNNTSVTGGSTLSLKTDSGGTEFLSDSMTLNNGTFQVTGGYYFLDYQGTLTLGSGGGTFNVAANTEAIWSGSIGGTGSLTASGPGTLTLLSSGNPMTMTYTGGTLIESGSTLKLGQNNLGVDYLGPGAVTLNGGTLKEAGALLSLTQNLALTSNGGKLDVGLWQMFVSGVISGSGALTFTAGNAPPDPNCYDCNGVVFLYGNNTNTGGIYVTGKTLLDVTNDSNFGAAGSPITLDNGNIETRFNDLSTDRNIYLVSEGGIEPEAHSVTVNGKIEGPGFLLLKDDGYVYLTNAANSYSGGTRLEEFTKAVVNADSNFGNLSSAVTMEGGGIQVAAGVSFNSSRTMFLDEDGSFDVNGYASSWNGLITGPGDFLTLSSNGNGSVTLTQQEDYAGETEIANYFISGMGGAHPITAGTTRLVLAVAGALPSATQVDIGWNGILDLGSLPQTIGGLEGETTALVDLGSGSLNVGNNDEDGEYEGTIIGTGNVIKVGAGTLILDGINSYSGGTDIQGGVLAVGDDITPTALILGPVTVESGGTLDGQGTVSGAVTNNGMVEVSIPSGALSITQLDDSSASQTGIHVLPQRNQSGRLNVGSVNLAGALTVTADPGNYGVRYRYLILPADSTLATTFDSLSTDLANFTPSLAYGANSVTLTLMRDNTDFTTNALTPNQTAVAVFLNQSVTVASDPFMDKMNEVYILPAPAQQKALSDMGGSSYGPLVPILLDDSHINTNLMLDQLSEGSSLGLGGSAPQDKTPAPGGSFWVRQVDHFGTWDGDPTTDVVGYNVSSIGVVLGNDGMLDTSTRVGWLLSYNRMDLSSTDGGDVQTGVDAYRAGLFATRPLGFMEISTLAQFGLNQYTTQRLITLGSDVNQAQSHFDAVQGTAALRVSFPLKLGTQLSLKPYLGFEYGLLVQYGFTEYGAGELDMTVAGQTYHSIRPMAGIDISGKWALDKATQLIPTLHAAVSREMGNIKPQVRGSYDGSPGNSFTTSGVTSADLTWIGLGAGAKLALVNHVNLYSNYTGYFGGGQTSHVVNAGASFGF